MKYKSNSFDTIIIGAGIAGLTCGCYLAKIGQKVLILEKNDKAGGYCVSFERNGFVFDVGIRGLSHSKEGGFIRKIIQELNLKLTFLKTEISDIITTPDYQIAYYTDTRKTLDSMKHLFPDESKSIDLFFELIKGLDNNKLVFSFFQEFKNKTFKNLLNQYFKNEKLKTLLKIPLGNLGLPSSLSSAISAIMFYHGFLFKGGYYIKGGMQALGKALVEKFEEYGGKIEFTQKTNSIKLNDKDTFQVTSKTNNSFFSKNVICNCDPTYAFTELIDKSLLDKNFYAKYTKLIPSSSAFMVYLGINQKLEKPIGSYCGLWYSAEYDIEKFYTDISDNKVNFDIKHIVISSPSMHDNTLAPSNCESLILTMWTPYVNKFFWKSRTLLLKENIIKRANSLIPNLSSSICIEETASPVTLQNYTLNRNGSIRGWSAMPSQLRAFHTLEKVTHRKILFVGQWSNQYAPGGLFTAMFSAKRVLPMIIAKKKK